MQPQPAYMPTPAQIAEAAAEIRRGWPHVNGSPIVPVDGRSVFKSIESPNPPTFKGTTKIPKVLTDVVPVNPFVSRCGHFSYGEGL